MEKTRALESLKPKPEHLRPLNALNSCLVAISQDYPSEFERMSKVADEMVSSQGASFRLTTKTIGEEKRVTGVLQVGKAAPQELNFRDDLLASLSQTDGRIDSGHIPHLKLLYNGLTDGIDQIMKQRYQGESVDSTLFNYYSSGVDVLFTIIEKAGPENLKAFVKRNRPELNARRGKILGIEAVFSQEIEALGQQVEELEEELQQEITRREAAEDLAKKERKKREEKEEELERLRKAEPSEEREEEIEERITAAREEGRKEGLREGRAEYLDLLHKATTTLADLEGGIQKAIETGDLRAIPDSFREPLESLVASAEKRAREKADVEFAEQTEENLGLKKDLMEAKKRIRTLHERIEEIGQKLLKRPTHEQMMELYATIADLKARLAAAEAIGVPEVPPVKPPLVEEAPPLPRAVVEGLTSEEIAAIQTEYQRLVIEKMGGLPPNAYEGVPPSLFMPVSLTEASRVDSLATAEDDPAFTPNRQFGLLRLIDGEFGGVMAIFRDGIAKVGERQLKEASLEELKRRSEAVSILAQKENAEVREQLMNLLTQKCVVGHVRREFYYTKSARYMISDLLSLAQASELKGKHRGLYVDIGNIRTNIKELVSVLGSLSRDRGDYFDNAKQELDSVLRGNFLREIDDLKTEAEKELRVQYRRQVAKLLRKESISREKKLAGIDKCVAEIRKLIKSEGYDFPRRLAEALESGDFSNEQVSRYISEIDRVMDGQLTNEHIWQNFNLFGEEVSSGQISPESIGRKLFATALKHKEEVARLSAILESLAFVCDISEVFAAIPPQHKPENPIWFPTQAGIEIKGAVHPYAVLRIVLAEGKAPADMTERELKYADVYDRRSSWPIPSGDADWAYRQNREYLKNAYNLQTPIDMHLSREKPFSLVVGNNGAGKTYALEILAQNLGLTTASGVNLFSRKQKLAHVPVVRTLINASRHRQRISSFQSESILQASVLQEISTKAPLELALAVFDEIGRGTDSRDALALMVGTLEYCRRHNTYLAVATHYGRRFLDLANLFGFQDLIQIYSPDPDTHELNKTAEVVPSRGIEVMETRGRNLGLPEELLGSIIENAKKIREVHDSRESTGLVSYPIPKDISKPLPFTTDEDLRDIGMSPTERSYDDINDSSIIIAVKSVLERIGIKFYPESRDPYSSKENTMFAECQAARIWRDSFEGRFVDQSLTTEEKAQRREDVHRLVSRMKSDKGEFTQVLDTTLNASIGLAALLPADMQSDEVQRAIRSIKKFREEDNPIGKHIYLSDILESQLDSFTTLISSRAKRREIFSALRATASYFEASPSIHFQNIAFGLRKLAERETELEQLFQTQDVATPQFYKRALGRYILDETESEIKWGREEKLEDFKAVLGEEFQKMPQVYTYLEEQVSVGDLSGVLKVRRWLRDQDLSRAPSYDFRVKIKKYFDCFGAVEEAIANNLDKEEKLWHKVKSRVDGIGLGSFDNASQIAQAVTKRMVEGKFDLFDEVMTTLAEEGVVVKHGPVRDIDQFRRDLASQKWVAWQEYLQSKVEKQEEIPATTDYYRVLGISAKATDREITRAFRKLSSAFHTDTLYATALDELLDISSQVDRRVRARMIEEAKGRADWGNIDTQARRLARAKEEAFKTRSGDINEAYTILSDESKRKAYDEAYAQRSLEEAEFYLTAVNAVDKFDMVQPSRSRDGEFKIEHALSLGLIDALGRDNTVPQSLHFSGNVDTVVIGGPNGGGKSHTLITMANIIQWADVLNYVPAKSAILPEVDFFVSAVNAGESIIGKSSFQREIDRYLGVVKRYIDAGCPRNGIVFLDEPLASTSSEDQTGILISLLDFFRSRGVKVIITNHNHATYDLLNRVRNADGKAINFLPVAFSADKDKPFVLEYYDPSRTDEIKSQGIDIAEEMGVDPSIIAVARHVRGVIDRMETRKNADRIAHTP